MFSSLAQSSSMLTWKSNNNGVGVILVSRLPLISIERGQEMSRSLGQTAEADDINEPVNVWGQEPPTGPITGEAGSGPFSVWCKGERKGGSRGEPPFHIMWPLCTSSGSIFPRYAGFSQLYTCSTWPPYI